MIKPDVVLYEESLDENMIDKSIRAISQADTLIIGGNISGRLSGSWICRLFQRKTSCRDQ